MRYRFYSDSNQAQFGLDVQRLGFAVYAEGDVIEVLGESPEVDSLAKLCSGFPEDAEKPNSSIGVEANTDMAAFSIRSSAALMPAYEPPPLTTTIPKTCIPKTPRRATLGQPL